MQPEISVSRAVPEFDPIDPISCGNDESLLAQLRLSPIAVGLAGVALLPFPRTAGVTCHHHGGCRAGAGECDVCREAISGGLHFLNELAVAYQLISEAAVSIREGRRSLFAGCGIRQHDKTRIRFFADGPNAHRIQFKDRTKSNCSCLRQGLRTARAGRRRTQQPARQFSADRERLPCRSDQPPVIW